jgi:hypothetical protein
MVIIVMIIVGLVRALALLSSVRSSVDDSMRVEGSQVIMSMEDYEGSLDDKAYYVLPCCGMDSDARA